MFINQGLLYINPNINFKLFYIKYSKNQIQKLITDNYVTPKAPLMAQQVKNLPSKEETQQIWFLISKISGRGKWQLLQYSCLKNIPWNYMMIFYFYLVCFTFSILYSVHPFHLDYVFQFPHLFFFYILKALSSIIVKFLYTYMCIIYIF